MRPHCSCFDDRRRVGFDDVGRLAECRSDAPMRTILLAARVRIVRRASLREGVMTIRSSWLEAVQAGMQRFAAGIDVSSQDVRLVVVSQRARACAPLQIEYVRTVPLPPNAMAGIEIADRQAVSRALRDAFADLPHSCATSAL